MLQMLKSYLSPWYIVFVAGGTLCVYGLLKSASEEFDSPLALYGWLAAIVFLLTAHAFRCLYSLEYIKNKEIYDSYLEAVRLEKDNKNEL